MISKKENRLLKTSLKWSRWVNFTCLFLLFAIALSYCGYFTTLPILGGFLVLGVTSGAFSSLVDYWMNLRKESFSLTTIFLAFCLVISAALTYSHSPFPAFSGRDEGSYANAAIYLAKHGSINFQLPLLAHLKGEGPAHQSLNFPGFVIRGEYLSSQFSPAYFVLQALFYKIFGFMGSFFLVNIFLVSGGLIGFFFFFRLFFSRSVSAAGMAALAFNFLLLWFSRFSLSENLYFFLFANLMLFVGISVKYGISKEFSLPIMLGAAMLPLTRPEGWWTLLWIFIGLAAVFFKRKINWGWEKMSQWRRRGEFLSFVVMAVGAEFVLIYTLAAQFPVYLRLIKDWLSWIDQKVNYQSLTSGTFNFSDFWEIIFSFFPSFSKIAYFWRVEWIYGVLVFVLPAFLLFGVMILKRDWIFSIFERNTAKILFFLSIPSWAALFSPQISVDHPWMLRRFYPVLLPLSVWLLALLVSKLLRKLAEDSRKVALSSFLALMLLPTLPANAYFLGIKENAGREKIFWQLGSIFGEKDYVFFEREASGDGWKMWAEPLSSLKGINSAYVYSPENLAADKKFLEDNIDSGGRNFLVAGSNSYWFDHEIAKKYDLMLERELTFKNKELDLRKDSAGFPLFSSKTHTVKIYRLIPK